MSEPILLTPGPLTTTAATKAAMLRDWGAWDGAFNELTASVCTDLVRIVNAATNAAAIILFGLTGELYWLLGLAMSVCNIAGAQFGSHLAIRRGSALVRKVFIVVVFALITKTAWDAIRLHL